MPHCDGDVLALRALGEPAGTPEDGTHLETCTQCRSQIDELAHAAAIARSVTIEDHQRPKVANRVWSSIVAAVPELAEVPEAADVPEPAEQPRPPVTETQDVPAFPTGVRAVSRRDPRRRWLVAAVLAAVLGVGAGAAGMWVAQRPAAVQASEVLRAPLGPLGPRGGHGTADLQVVGQERRLHVRLSGGAVPGRFLEVWLADRAAKKMVAVGVLDSREQGTFTVPATLDLDTYRLIDVSAQAYDGNPAHSTLSVARGQLTP